MLSRAASTCICVSRAAKKRSWDSTLTRKQKKQGIKVEHEVSAPETLPFPDTELCTVLMNLLQNALDANALAPAGAEKWLRVTSNKKPALTGFAKGLVSYFYPMIRFYKSPVILPASAKLDAEMDAAEPFPIQAWKQVGKILVDV